MLRLRPHSLAFTLLLASLVTLASFATDMGLPVLDATAASLGVAPATAALTLSVFMAGFALGPVVFGPLSDRRGRRPVLLAACATFALFGVLGAFAGSLQALLAWRFLMGAGAGTAQVLVLAIVRDLFTGDDARVKQSYVNLAAGIAPIVAPTVGVWVAAAGGWRAIYGVLAGGATALLLAAALFLGESAPLRHARASHVGARGGTLRNYARVLRHPVTMGYAVLSRALLRLPLRVRLGLVARAHRPHGRLAARVRAAVRVDRVRPHRRLAHERAPQRRGVPHTRLIAAGLGIVAATGVLLLALAAAGALTAWSLVPLIILSHAGQGVMRPNAAQSALEPMPDIAGVGERGAHGAPDAHRRRRERARRVAVRRPHRRSR